MTDETPRTRRPYRRVARYPVRLALALSTDQHREIETLADATELPVVEVIRLALDEGLPRVRKRLQR